MVALSWGRRVSCETVCASQPAPCWTFGCAARSHAVVLTCRPPSRMISGSRPLGVDPLQSLHVLSAGRPSRAGADSHEVLRPFDDIPRASPVCGGSSTTTAVPLPGLRNLSAVSWHARASRPCLMPQPPVGFSLRSFPPRRGRVRLSASPCSLAVLRRPSIPRARTRPFHSGFHRRPRLSTRLPGSPPELGHRFHRACAYARIGFPGALTLPAHLGANDDRLRLPRSLDPPAKPYRGRRRSDVPRPLLSWASPLQSLPPIEPRGLMSRRTVPSTAR